MPGKYVVNFGEFAIKASQFLSPISFFRLVL